MFPTAVPGSVQQATPFQTFRNELSGNIVCVVGRNTSETLVHTWKTPMEPLDHGSIKTSSLWLEKDSVATKQHDI